MAIRRCSSCFLFIVVMLMSYLYISNKYNINTVEYAFTGELSYKQFESLRKSTKALIKRGTENKELICIVNYIGSFKDNRLIMTTGFDNLVKYTPMTKGYFISSSQAREAAIGDKAANRLYRSINIVGQTINIYGQEYKITGIIKNSEDIYITFNENNNISWSKKNIKFIIENQRYLYLYTEILEGKLRIIKLDVVDSVIYKQEAYLYINIMFIVILILLIRVLKSQVKQIIKISKETYAKYREQSMSIEVIKYLRKHMDDIIQIAKKLAFSVMSLIAIIKCISFIHIPSNVLPSNLFALSSYIDTINLNADILLNRLDYGIRGIMLEIYILNFFLLITLPAAVFYIYKRSRCFKLDVLGKGVFRWQR